MPTPRGVLPALLALATAAGGYLLGSSALRAPPTDDALAGENESLRARVADLERDLAGRPLPLAVAGGGSAAAPSGTAPTSAGPRVASPAARTPGEDIPFPAFSATLGPDAYVQECLAYLAAQFARGPEGHLAILKAIDEHLVKGEGMRQVFASEEDAVRAVYPLLKFAVTHEDQVVDLLATTFRTMAESPQALADLDSNTLEIFTEGLGLVLPGVVSQERLGTFSGWVTKVLEAPKGSLPQPVEGNRSELGRLLTAWAPPLTVDQAVEALAAVETMPAERIAALVRRLPPEALARVDVARVVGPLLDQGNHLATRLLQTMQPSAGDIAALDRRQIAALNAGQGLHAPSYLAATGRPSFDAARGFYDAWGATSDLSAQTYAHALVNARAPATYLRDVVARVTLPDAVRTLLQSRIEHLERTTAPPGRMAAVAVERRRTVDEQVRCPHCGGANTPAQRNAPYFCRECKRIVDPNKAIARPTGGFAPSPAELDALAPAPPSPGSTAAPPSGTSSGNAGMPSGYVSRYGTAISRDLLAPAAQRAVAGSLWVGLLLAAGAGLVTGVVLGWIGESFLRIPLLYPFLVGWAIKRALALGSGGGTPDRGLVGGMLFLVVVIGSFGLMRWIEYRTIASRQNEHYASAYGLSAPRAVAERGDVVAGLRERDLTSDGVADGAVKLSDGGHVSVQAEQDRLAAAFATGRVPTDGYDLELLAALGRPGFRGHLAHATGDGGSTLRLLPGSRGIPLPGIATLILWIVELGVLLVTAFSHYDD